MRTMVYVNKWITLTVSIFCQASSGLSYAFSLYSTSLQVRPTLHQTAMKIWSSNLSLPDSALLTLTEHCFVLDYKSLRASYVV